LLKWVRAALVEGSARAGMRGAALVERIMLYTTPWAADERGWIQRVVHL
jgi:hypothetical protein